MEKFKLPNGTEITLRVPLAKDIESLDKWFRQTYIQQANETVKMLPDTVQKQFMLDVLDKAMILSTQFGDGRNMLFANVYGAARFLYSHIAEQDKMTFEQFHEILFPGGFLVDEGQIAFADMLRLLYPDNQQIQNVADAVVENRQTI
jgi:hypothetical protein